MVIGEGRHGGQDWTAAMVPPNATLLERIAADTEQLAVLDDILNRWPRRCAMEIDTTVSAEWYDDPGARQGVEQHLRSRLYSEAGERWPDCLVFGVRVGWRPGQWDGGRHTSWQCIAGATVLPAVHADIPTDVFPAVAGGKRVPMPESDQQASDQQAENDRLRAEQQAEQDNLRLRDSSPGGR